MPRPEREQQRKHENPENNFRLALQFQQARHQQMAVARPAAVARGGHWRVALLVVRSVFPVQRAFLVNHY